MEVGLWVGGSMSHSEFLCGKSSQNTLISKPVLIFWSSIPCVFCLYIYGVSQENLQPVSTKGIQF